MVFFKEMMVKDLTKQKTETKETKQKSVKARVKNKVQFFFQNSFLIKYIWITFRWHVPHDDDDDIDGETKNKDVDDCMVWLFSSSVAFEIQKQKTKCFRSYICCEFKKRRKKHSTSQMMKIFKKKFD